MKYQKGYTDERLFFAFVVFAFFALVALFVGIDWMISKSACASRAQGLGLEHTWGPVQGCLVKVGKRYAPIEYIRIVDDDTIIIQGDGE